MATVKQTVRRIEARNRRFKKMTRAQQRVAVAKDALRLIQTGKIRAKHGSYRDIPGNRAIVSNLEANATETQALLLAGKFPKCECCALGCLLIAAVRQGDGMDANTLEMTDAPHRSKPLTRLFSQSQIDEIEGSFEGQDPLYSGDDARPHIVKVFKSIIANKGKVVAVN